MSTSAFHNFSEDITRTVFEEAARANRRTALVLALVSHTTRRWIDRIIYQQVSILEPKSVSLFRRSVQLRNDNAFYAQIVQNLDIDMENTADAEHILTVCTGLSSLTTRMLKASNLGHLFSETPPMTHLASLRRLAITDPYEIAADSLPPNVTHFSVGFTQRYRTNMASTLMEILQSRQSITHFAYHIGPYEFSNRENFVFIEKLLVDPCPHLRMFIIVCGNGLMQQGGAAHDLEEEFQRMRDTEPRIVILDTEKERLGKLKNILYVDPDVDDVWHVAEEYMMKGGHGTGCRE